MAGLALVMAVLVILFSGRNAPKPVPKEPPFPPTTDPNLPRIEDVRQRIDDLANKNRTAQERIATLQAGMANPIAPMSTGQPFLPSATQPVYGGRSYAYQDLNPQRSWVDPEEQKRESRAPFASNIALSYRKEDQSNGQDSPDAVLRSLAANFADGGNRPPSQVPSRHNVPPRRMPIRTKRSARRPTPSAKHSLRILTGPEKWTIRSLKGPCSKRYSTIAWTAIFRAP